MRFGVDYTSRIAPAALKAAGVTFVCRYLAPPGQAFDWKRVSRSEVDELQAEHIAQVFVFESSAGRALDGHNAGVSDASMAKVELAALRRAFAPAYFAVDTDVPDFAPHLPDTPANARAKLGQVANYFEGAISVLGLSRVGAYGDFYVVRRLRWAGLAAFFWQTEAWSGGQWDGAHILRQENNGVPGRPTHIAGQSVDWNEVLDVDFGQWPRPSKPAPAPKPVPPPAPVPPVKPPHVPSGKPMSPFWVWVAWRDLGGDPKIRPVGIPHRIPLSWVYRYWLHQGMKTPLPKAVKAYLDKHLVSP